MSRFNSLSAHFVDVALKHHDDLLGDEFYVDKERTKTMTGQRFAPRGAQGAPAATKAPTPTREKRMTIANVKSGAPVDAPRIFIYGDGGLGKSTFFHERGGTVFIDTQDGTEGIVGAKRYPRPEVWQDVLDAIEDLTVSDHNYRMVAIDLIDDVERLLWAYVCDRDGKSDITAYGYNKGFDVAMVEWRTLVSKLERLRETKGMAIAFSGHGGVNKFKNPEAEDFGVFGPLLHEKPSSFLRGWCDAVLFARLETYTHGGGKNGRARGVSTGERIIHTVGTAAYFAKNRYNLPDTLKLDWAEYDGAVKASAADMLREIEDLRSLVDEETNKAVGAAIEKAGADHAQIARVLNRLRQVAQPQQQQTQEVGQQ